MLTLAQSKRGRLVALASAIAFAEGQRELLCRIDSPDATSGSNMVFAGVQFADGFKFRRTKMQAFTSRH